MLPPSQVLPLVVHSNPAVRRLALNYINDLGESAPPGSAQVIWQAIDLCGDQTGDFGLKYIGGMLRVLHRVPQDEHSIGRAIDLLSRVNDLDHNGFWWLNEYFEWLGLEKLAQHEPRIIPHLMEASRVAIRNRRELRGQAADQLWSQLLEHARITDSLDQSQNVDMQRAAQLTEALAEHREFSIAHAMRVLSEHPDQYWLTTWSIQLLGRLRHAPAIDLIVQRMQEDDGDFLHGMAALALRNTDPVQTVAKLAEWCEAHPVDAESDDDVKINQRLRIYAALGKIKDEQAESALLKLLPRETDPAALSVLCAKLVDLATTAGFEPIRQVAIDERYDRSMADVRQEVITLADALGVNLPERDEWEKLLADDYHPAGRRDGQYENDAPSYEDLAGFREIVERMEASLADLDSARALPEPGPYYKVTQPIRREEPKIGRNDPCPCGSGKKYKKCCAG